MSDILKSIRAHSEPDKVRTISVPEWIDEASGQPLVIHHTMVTLGDLADAQLAAQGSALRIEAEVVCIKAEDENGKKLFRRIDVLELMQVADPVVLRRVANAMMGQSRSADDIAKN